MNKRKINKAAGLEASVERLRHKLDNTSGLTDVARQQLMERIDRLSDKAETIRQLQTYEALSSVI